MTDVGTSPGRVPILLDGIRRMAEQLLEQTADVERWMADQMATHEAVDEHLFNDLCDCDSRKPALCDKHAAVMLMVGGPLDGHITYWRSASAPPSPWSFALPRKLNIAGLAGAAELSAIPPRTEYTRQRRLQAGPLSPSRAYLYVPSSR